MKLTIDYATLCSSLDYALAIVDDSLMPKELKNFIFQVSENDLTLITHNPNTVAVSRTLISKDDYKVEFAEGDLEVGADGVGRMYMQIKSKELTDFLGTFKSLTKTKATDVEFNVDSLKVKLAVYEEALSEEDVKLNQVSRWTFDNMALNRKSLSEITMPVDRTQGQALSSSDIAPYLLSLFPLLENGGTNNLQSKLHFGEEHVFAINAVFASFMKNGLPDAFKGIVLTYSTINFLKKVISSNDVVTVQKTDSHIIICTDSLEAFFRYQVKTPPTETYLNSYKRDNAIVLDRRYFRDVLKRLSLGDDQIQVSITPADGVMKVSNKKFTQEVPLLQTKGLEGIDNVEFKLAKNVIGKVIIGDDSSFPEDLRIYIVPMPKTGYQLYFADCSDLWFSVLQVR